MLKMNLNQDWELTFANLELGPDRVQQVLDQARDYLPCHIPCDVHVPLIASGLIQDPVEALNCYGSEWVERKSWWFRKRFHVDVEAASSDLAELVLESLDYAADIFLNGVCLGQHRNAFRPFTADVRDLLRPGENTLVVRLTSGLEQVSELDTAPLAGYGNAELDEEPEQGTRKRAEGQNDRGDIRRSWVRKPQYVFGWDWNPRIATIGIMKDVYLVLGDRLLIRDVQLVTVSAGTDLARLEITVNVENLHLFQSFDGKIRAELRDAGETAAAVEKIEHLRCGCNYIRLSADIAHPKLWWPNGMGSQARYEVRVTASAAGVEAAYPPFWYGIRILRLNMDPLGEGERLFAFEVNGVKAFCRGGNWIPADSIYGRVSDEKYDRLLREAKEAHFTMLRVWGGGLYEKDIFYEKCDEYGILLWHDFMFACAIYPDDQERFRQEAARELDYQTKRLRNYACMAVWCGNNEIHWGFSSTWTEAKKNRQYGGALIYNRIAPAIIEQNCRNIPYWNSSPYGGDEPNSAKIGDSHHWAACTMNPEMAKRITPQEYDQVAAKFVSEYGYIGPCALSTIAKYHAGYPVDRQGDIWKLHNNTFEKETVVAGIQRHYRDAGEMAVQDYLLYASLCQGLMLQYSLEAIRFKKDCWGSLFWMYNDCWGEVGWSIIDYYLMRKPSFYYVKRAFAPLKLIMRERESEIEVMGINDSPKSTAFDLEYGYVSFDGMVRQTAMARIELPSFSRDVKLRFRQAEAGCGKGINFVRPLADGIDPALLYPGEFRKLNVARGQLRTDHFARNRDTASFVVTSDIFAHAVHFGLGDDIRLSDEYFDLLPGEKRKVTVFNPPDGFSAEDIQPAGVTV